MTNLSGVSERIWGRFHEREFGNLKDVGDNYPKYVVTLNDGPLNEDMDGIRCCKLVDFLMSDRY